MRRNSLVLALAFGFSAMFAATAAQAELKPIPSKAGKDWRHALTGTNFPPQIGELPRRNIADYGNQQLDIAAIYEQPETGTVATVYVYRAGLPDASIWHDRILKVMGGAGLGEVDQSKKVTTIFTPKGQGENSGIRSVVPLSGKAQAASGVAVFAHDDWLIVVRMTSASLAPADLDPALATFVDALGIGAAKNPATAAYGITPCAQPFPTQTVERGARDMTGGLLAGALMQVVEEGKVKPDKGEGASEIPHYCSDPGAVVDYGAYRNEKDAGNYLIAVGDDGNVIWLAPDTMAALLDEKKSGQYAMTLTTVANRVSYAPFTAMPGPAQVMKVLQSERPISVVNRAIGKSKNKTITIAPD